MRMLSLYYYVSYTVYTKERERDSLLYYTMCILYYAMNAIHTIHNMNNNTKRERETHYYRYYTMRYIIIIRYNNNTIERDRMIRQYNDLLHLHEITIVIY